VQAAADVQACCAAAAVALRTATGFDRAMVYRFLPDESGEVVAEDARAGLESFLGLHYPASDIPRQARELYRRNWLRTIPDIEYVPAPLQPPLNPRTGQTVDMSHCALRSVSPIHVEYLRNMGVCASMSASIVCQDKLWGMLVLHHYAPHHVSAELRVACETFAQIFSHEGKDSARRVDFESPAKLKEMQKRLKDLVKQYQFREVSDILHDEEHKTYSVTFTDSQGAVRKIDWALASTAESRQMLANRTGSNLTELLLHFIASH